MVYRVVLSVVKAAAAAAAASAAHFPGAARRPASDYTSPVASAFIAVPSWSVPAATLTRPHCTHHTAAWAGSCPAESHLVAVVTEVVVTVMVLVVGVVEVATGTIS
ncbi:hypothetical protein E2C01_002755 [Portunus trituberculatus]|uniref:Secreted protein n=1 Tax=Portunus trituberculatus TaxID=210409 RepID=A0A5B7CP23_PORTR|nr:hypothetical protein [Portunus trituberculatus]